MVKKAKKTSKKSTSRKAKQETISNNFENNSTQNKKPGFLKFLLLAFLVLLGLAAIFFALKQAIPGFLGSSLSGKLAATVNGEEITMAQLDKDYNSLPSQYQLMLSKEDFLDQLIEQKLLEQEAAKLGINPTQQEIQENIDKFVSQYNMTQEELDELLKNKSMTQADLEDISREQLISKAMLEVILKDVVVFDAEALQYYNDHASTFKQPEEFVARHIMFAIALTNRTTAQAHSEAVSVMSQILPDKSNYCALATKYSDDKRSAVACGQYSFTEGQMPPEFEAWVMKSKPGDMAVVDTEYGSHIILYMNKTPEKIILFKDVKDQIASALKSQKEKIAYQDFVDNLKKNAIIVNNLKKDVVTSSLTNEQLDAQAQNEINAMQEETPVEETPVVETKPVVEVKPVETTPVVETKPTTTVNVVTNGFSKCFLAKSPVLYGAQWDSSTITQKNLLGDSLAQVTYVECFAKGEYKTALKVCSDLKISAYPTWRVGGEKILGTYSIKQIEALVGC